MRLYALQIMRNQINLRTAVVTMWCPMAVHKPGIVSIKINGKYDNEEQVFDQALEMVHKWQKENDRRGNFIFDRDPIWHRVSARPNSRLLLVRGGARQYQSVTSFGSYRVMSFQ